MLDLTCLAVLLLPPQQPEPVAPAPGDQRPVRGWQSVASEGAPTGRAAAAAVCTGRAILIWGGLDAADRFLGDGASYDVGHDRWRAIVAAGAPTPRARHTAVWSGREMIVWGGDSPLEERGDGAAFDPVGQLWRPLPLEGAPRPRGSHTAVWTGAEMWIWAGVDDRRAFPAGGRYDPLQNDWTRLDLASRDRVPRTLGAVWSGRALLAWGGINGSSTLASGLVAPLEPAGSTPISRIGAPVARAFHSCVWTGREMLVWGGSRSVIGGSPLADGGAYDPQVDRWRPLPGGGPSARYGQATAWTGEEMLVLGGAAEREGDALADAWALDPDGGWRRLPDLPEPRVHSFAFVVDGEVVLVGGRDAERLRVGGFRLRF